MVMPDKFFSKVMKADWQKSYKLLAEVIVSEFKPKSVIDYGACAGWMLEYLRRKGVRVLCGIEPARAASKYAPESIKSSMFDGDLTTHLDLGHRYDVAACLEVAEHIAEEHAATIVRNVTRHSPVVLWSAATPGQGGCGHVNEQPHSYWDKLFTSLDFLLDSTTTKRVRSTLKRGGAKKWYYKNACVFRSVDAWRS